jgi:hypothetical protein
VENLPVNCFSGHENGNAVKIGGKNRQEKSNFRSFVTGPPENESLERVIFS